MNPWDRFAARMYGTGDVITNSAGDTLVHDEILIHPGEIKGDCIVAVMCHANDRMMARWGPMLNQSARFKRPLVKPGFLQRYAPHSRYNKWEV